MQDAVVWYKSRTIILLIAGLVLAAGNKFGVFPKELTQDNLADFLMYAVPVILAIASRAKSTKVVTSSAQKAADINAGVTPAK